MKNFALEKRIKSLSSLPTLKRKNKDMSFIDEYSDDKIHNICEACHNIIHMKFPLENKKKKQLKKNVNDFIFCVFVGLYCIAYTLFI